MSHVICFLIVGHTRPVASCTSGYVLNFLSNAILSSGRVWVSLPRARRYGMTDKAGSWRGGKWEPDWLGIPYVRDGVFVGIWPEDYATNTKLKWIARCPVPPSSQLKS
eukprot:2158284-Amphidinium_carterae.1